MKYLFVAALAFALTACSDPLTLKPASSESDVETETESTVEPEVETEQGPTTYEFELNINLDCVGAAVGGETQARRVNYTNSFTTTATEHYLGWSFMDGTWVVIDRQYGGQVWSTVTPLPGENCTPVTP